MTEQAFQELDVVALTSDVPEEGLHRGQVGTIVHVYAPDAFEVEFIDRQGHTYGLATLGASQLLRLQYDPIAA
jgi:hypothetical protein